MKFLSILLILSVFTCKLIAQNNSELPYKTWSVHIGLQATNPNTDIRYRDFFGTVKPKNENQWGVKVGAIKMFDDKIGLRFSGQLNHIVGVFDSLVPFGGLNRVLTEQNEGFENGVYFKNNVVSFSTSLYWNITNSISKKNRIAKASLNGKKYKGKKMLVYTHLGFGFEGHDAHLMHIEDNAPFTFSKNKDVSTLKAFIPLGLGGRIYLSPLLDIGIEYEYFFLVSDALDGYFFNHPGRMFKADSFNSLGILLHFKSGKKNLDNQHIEWAKNVR